MLQHGKIAGIPENIREQLNSRLHNGESDLDLVNWLNSLPKAQAILKREFGGELISETDLILWRYSGYEEWLVKKYESVSLPDFQKWCSEEATMGQLQDVTRANFKNLFRTRLRCLMEDARILSWLLDNAMTIPSGMYCHKPPQTKSPSAAR